MSCLKNTEIISWIIDTLTISLLTLATTFYARSIFFEIVSQFGNLNQITTCWLVSSGCRVGPSAISAGAFSSWILNLDWACLFWLLAASGHQKLLRTAKRSAFQPASIKFLGAKTVQNQHKHIIGWVVVIVGIRYFLDPEPYEQLYLPPHIIVMILKFSPQPDSSHSQIFRKAGQKKAEPNRPDGWRVRSILTKSPTETTTTLFIDFYSWEQRMTDWLLLLAYSTSYLIHGAT